MGIAPIANAPVLLALEYIGGGEYAIRYSCRDSSTFYEIKSDIIPLDRSERRWDPDECNGKGAWVVDERVLTELDLFFPSIPAWLQKSAQPDAASRDIQDVPF